MESHGGGAGPSAEEARRQLDQLGDDGRWAQLVRSTPETFWMLLTGSTVLSLILFALAHAGVGPDPENEGTLAFSWLLIPFLGQAQVLHKHSGSYFGAPGKRPRVREVAALVTAYVAGLVPALWFAGRGAWVGVVLVACATAGVVAWLIGRWIARYRGERRYRAPRVLWWSLLLYVVAMLATGFALVTVLAVVDRLLNL